MVALDVAADDNGWRAQPFRYNRCKHLWCYEAASGGQIAGGNRLNAEAGRAVHPGDEVVLTLRREPQQSKSLGELEVVVGDAVALKCELPSAMKSSTALRPVEWAAARGTRSGLP